MADRDEALQIILDNAVNVLLLVLEIDVMSTRCILTIILVMTISGYSPRGIWKIFSPLFSRMSG